MRLQRREFLKGTAALAAISGLPAGVDAAVPVKAKSYPYLGRIEEDANAGEKLYSPALKVVDGKVKIPDDPGWGMKINPAWTENAAYLKSERSGKP